MQNYYEIETDIPVNHQLTILLPENIPVGRAKVAIIYQQPPSLEKITKMTEFLNDLPENTAEGLSRLEIETYIQQERAAWDY